MLLLDLRIAHSGGLRLFDAHLLVRGFFKEAIQGCDIVTHRLGVYLSTADQRSNEGKYRANP